MNSEVSVQHPGIEPYQYKPYLSNAGKDRDSEGDKDEGSELCLNCSWAGEYNHSAMFLTQHLCPSLRGTKKEWSLPSGQPLTSKRIFFLITVVSSLVIWSLRSLEEEEDLAQSARCSCNTLDHFSTSDASAEPCALILHRLTYWALSGYAAIRHGSSWLAVESDKGGWRPGSYDGESLTPDLIGWSGPDGGSSRETKWCRAATGADLKLTEQVAALLSLHCIQPTLIEGLWVWDTFSVCVPTAANVWKVAIASYATG